MNSKLILIVGIFTATLVAGCAGFPGEFPTKEEIRGYSSIGRVKWHVPTGKGFYFAVPHFTQGPRLKCEFPKSGECEISVYARDLRIDFENRKKEYFAEMQALLKDAEELAVEVQSYGSGVPVLYATLTDKRRGESYRYLTRGLYVRGPFIIKFEHLTNDASGVELSRILKTVHSAEPLDAMAIFTWKLSDYKTICGERFPELKSKNDAAFSSSKFANVDWVKLMQPSDGSSTSEQISTRFEKAKQQLAESFAKRPPDEFQSFCQSFPAQVKEAERGLL
ncbi:MAG: hypothetical protein A2W18_00660 [Candidatus Muproteobacteria bacterium RBG_16_60_9]|uniref:Lipoprotein n=1 Tax=Candidatus Muproteobacteria bacterium RBG_16_60_9 TaxID=1817755 RepID=A0A1F6V5Q8_9PROT|nr:MAG: hypothetical protein A2W18_00660 [Candidatus Muproteobacteria bacterium RBG_16_60_9]